ncbi:P2Y purinoceptor 11 isoform X1 [Rissa tridactyla]|uniref:P2Y purinoceptor 11 isoform X1 n=1 Tax=Rissa tridactyla TaxID=75485 RepID=UPI0023BA4FE6|nr:P2Y purinoceptor 11 isoform X1 [Rissa tridactyla]
MLPQCGRAEQAAPAPSASVPRAEGRCQALSGCCPSEEELPFPAYNTPLTAFCPRCPENGAGCDPVIATKVGGTGEDGGERGPQEGRAICLQAVPRGRALPLRCPQPKLHPCLQPPKREAGPGGTPGGTAPPPHPEMATNFSHCKNFSGFQESLWPVLAAQFPAALGGNGVAVYRFLAHERSWHSGIVYSFHLAVSGMLYSLSLPFLVAYYYPPKHWRYGPVLCKLERFLFNSNLYGGIFFVTCISLNRYLGIVHPLWVHGRLRPHHAKVLSAVIWVLAGVFSAPTLFFAELQEAEGAIECLGSAVPRRLREFYPYSLVLATLGCGLPFLLTTSCYAAIIRTVFRNPHLSQPEKRKVGILVGVGVALYAFSYLPYHIFRNLNLRQRLLPRGTEDCTFSRTIHTTAQVCKILVNLNICLHPLLYAALADSMQSCCGAGCSTGSAAEEPAEHVELRPAT